MGEESEERKFQFLRNGDAEPSDLDWNKGVESARQAISEAMNARNIAFLLGAGCSSLMKDKKELGIATMAPLAKEFCGESRAHPLRRLLACRCGSVCWWMWRPRGSILSETRSSNSL